MKPNIAIGNIHNPVIRKLTLILSSPLVLLAFCVIFVYSLIVGICVGTKAILKEVVRQNSRAYHLLIGGCIYDWMGKDAYEARVQENMWVCWE